MGTCYPATDAAHARTQPRDRKRHRFAHRRQRQRNPIICFHRRFDCGIAVGDRERRTPWYLQHRDRGGDVDQATGGRDRAPFSSRGADCPWGIEGRRDTAPLPEYQTDPRLGLRTGRFSQTGLGRDDPLVCKERRPKSASPFMKAKKKLAAGSGGSIVVDRCQVCDSPNLEPILFLGYLPPVNTMPVIGSPLAEQPAYPAELLFCKNCTLAQLGLIVDPAILFPPSYPYTSGTTKILRENFAELSREVDSLYPLKPKQLIA